MTEPSGMDWLPHVTETRIQLPEIEDALEAGSWEFSAYHAMPGGGTHVFSRGEEILETGWFWPELDSDDTYMLSPVYIDGEPHEVRDLADVTALVSQGPAETEQNAQPLDGSAGQAESAGARAAAQLESHPLFPVMGEDAVRQVQQATRRAAEDVRDGDSDGRSHEARHEAVREACRELDATPDTYYRADPESIADCDVRCLDEWPELNDAAYLREPGDKRLTLIDEDYLNAELSADFAQAREERLLDAYGPSPYDDYACEDARYDEESGLDNGTGLGC